MENGKLTNIGLCGVLIFTLVIAVQTQSHPSQYVISAKAGGINFVAGDVKTMRKDTTIALPVSTLDSLENGDRIQTGPDERTEILLNPGSYLRLGENSILEVTDTSLDCLRFKLSTGGAIIEVAGDDDEITPIELSVAAVTVTFNKRGIYQTQYREPATATVRIHKGRVQIAGDHIGVGKEIVIDRGNVVDFVKFDKKERDGFALWSSARAETIAAANGKLSKETINFISSTSVNAQFGRNRRSSGYWIFDPFFGSRTFLPFYSGWSSPYGRRYHRIFGFSHSRFGSFRRSSRGNNRRVIRQVIIRQPVKHGGGRRH